MKKIKVELKDITKEKPENYKASSVALRPDQIKYLKDKGINLSKLIRMILDDIMKEGRK